MISAPLTLPMCSPIGDGAAALVVTGAPNGAAAAIHVRASALSATGGPAPGSVVQRATATAREQSGMDAGDVDVIEVHDATASAELEAYEHLGLAQPGEGNRLIVEGRTVLGGALPVNTGGGLLSRGHPVGATGSCRSSSSSPSCAGGRVSARSISARGSRSPRTPGASSRGTTRSR